MRVAVLYDAYLAELEAAPDTRGALDAVEAVSVALADLGHVPVRVPVAPDLHGWTAALAESGAAAVFNLCEGVRGESAAEPRVAGVVELLGLPMTGSGSDTLALARRKDRVNGLLAAAGLPVPAWTRVRPGERPPRWTRFPAIVKPAAEDASVGITQRSVVRDPAELERAVAEATHAHGPVLVQEFVAGRELAVGFVGEETLPISEIDFSGIPDGYWPIVCYRAKWVAGSVEDLGTVPRCPTPLDPALAAEAVRVARAAWELVEGRGYGRVDLRLDDAGRPHVLEVNPNPDLSPDAGLPRMAAARGWGYAELVARILAEAA